MYDIADGIVVCFKNKKDCHNLVLFSNNIQKTYDVGGMLFELVSDESIYLIRDKVKNMISIFPNKGDTVARGTITECFKWLYETVEDEELPVATELFRSTFSEAICQILNDEKQMAKFSIIEDFFNRAYELYYDQLTLFAVYVEAIATHASKISDQFQGELAESFKENIGEYFNELIDLCYLQQESDFRYVYKVSIKNFIQLLMFEYCRMKDTRKAIKICVNCGRFFIPQGRVDTLYCPLPSPGYSGKTCRDVGAQLRRKQKREDDKYLDDYHRKTCNLLGIIKRAKLNNPAAVPHWQGELDKLRDEHKRRKQKTDNEKEV